jgi:hypothetical protein
MNTIKKTTTRVKFDGMTFLHSTKCVDGNHEPKEYLYLNGVKYYKVKSQINIDAIPDSLDLELTIELPTAAEIKAIEKNKRVVVAVDGSLKEEINKEAIRYDSKYPGRKTKASFLNLKTGNYVSYVRAVQLKLV